jgi:CubicO group peptidase (beta-lactamase class C family)
MVPHKLLSPLPFLLILGAFISYGKGQAIDPIFEKMLDDYVENEFMPAIQVPGLTLAIVYKGQILAKGYGYGNLLKTRHHQ